LARQAIFQEDIMTATTKAAAHERNGAAPANGKPKAEAQVIVISPPKMEHLAVTIRGTSIYGQLRFGPKAMAMMQEAQEAGQQGKKGRKREPKNFKALYEEAKHVSEAGWCGIPASAFRNAAISACRLVNFKMTIAKLSLFTLADGNDVADGTPLVRITKGSPRMIVSPVRNANGGADLRPRPIWDPGWEASVVFRYDAEQFSANDVANLLDRIGKQIGIGEGRADSKDSAGIGWGFFELVSVGGADARPTRRRKAA
jgi:hypothetical protein